MSLRLTALAALIGPLLATLPAYSADKKEDAAKEAIKKLEGNWVLVRSETKGTVSMLPPFKEGLFFEEGKVVWTKDGKPHPDGRKADLTLDPTAKPASIDFEYTAGPANGKTILGIYEFKGDKLTLCWNPPDGKRPSKFTSKTAVGAGLVVNVYQKVKD